MVEPRRPFMGPRRPLNSDRPVHDQGGVQEVTDGLNSNVTGGRVMPTARRGYGNRPGAPFSSQRDNLNVPETPHIQETHHEHHHKQPKNESFLEAFIKLINSILRLKGK